MQSLFSALNNMPVASTPFVNQPKMMQQRTMSKTMRFAAPATYRQHPLCPPPTFSSVAHPVHCARRPSTHTTPSAMSVAPPSSRSISAHSLSISDYFANDQRPIILFDGVCNLCNGAVNFMLDIDAKGAFRLAALQSQAGRALLQRCGRDPDDISSIVLVQANGQHHIRSEAVLRIAEGLQVPFPIVAAALLPIPRLIRDPLYDLVADNRYLVFGRTPACRMSDPRSADRFVVD